MAERKLIPIVVEKDGSLIPEIRTNLHLGDEYRAHPTLVLPGIGSEGSVARHITELTPDTAVADALPYRQVDPDSREALALLAEKYALAAVEAFREAHDDEQAVPNVIAESQQGIGTVFAEAAEPSAFGDIAFLRPLGFNLDHLGETSDEILRTFVIRALKMMCQPDQSAFVDKWNLGVANKFRKHLGRGIGQQFSDALTTSVIPTLQHRVPERSAEGKRTLLIAGTRDILFPAHELSDAHRAIGSAGLELIVRNASHRSLATKRGARDLREVIDVYLYPAE